MVNSLYINKKNKIVSTPPPKAINPMIYEKTANGEEVHDIFSRLLKDRILFIGEEFTQDLASCIIGQLLYLDKQSDEDPISIYINSYGGELSSMFAIYDTMQDIKAPIYTVVLGTAASAAAVILSAGTKGKRFAMPNAEIMIHQPLGYGIEGQVTDITLSSKQMEKNKKKMLTILACHTGKTYEEVERDCERDCWFNSSMAVKYGLVDEIKKPSKIVPSVTHEAKRHNNRRR